MENLEINTNKKFKFDESVHYSIKGRKRYKAKLLSIFVCLMIVLLGCSVMFYFGNTTWDPNVGFSPEAHPKQPWQVALVAIASLLTIFSLVGFCLYCWFDINKFYKTQEEYFKTQKFQEEKAKALNCNLVDQKISVIKWYKKLGYITGQEKRAIIEQKKQLKKTKK